MSNIYNELNKVTSKISTLIKREYERRDIYIAKAKRISANIIYFFDGLIRFCISLGKLLYRAAKECCHNKKSLCTAAAVILIVGVVALTPDSCSDSATDSIESTTQSKKKQSSKLNKRSINNHISNSLSELEQTKGFDREIESFMRKWGLVGGTFALMRNDKLIYAKGYGYADKEREIECDAKNTFRLASASKLITATAIMKLTEQKKLALSSKVFGAEGILRDSLFLPLKDPNLKLITVEHLLRHTGGFKTPISDPAFANYSVARSVGAELPLKLDDMVKYSTQYRLRTRPGTNYDYSNLGYMILTKVIEVASGMTYEEYLQKHILHPAGCYNIYQGQNFSTDRDKNEVEYYEVKEADMVLAYDGSGRMTLRSDGGNNVNLLSGAGGLVASSAELLRFVASINGGGSKPDILSKKSIEAMTYDSNDRTKKPMGWATVHGSEWLRSGSMAGTCTLIKKQRDGYTWVFISNSSAWIAYHLSDHISSTITRAIAKVETWPNRDLFVD